jgi:hypothetical protein
MKKILVLFLIFVSPFLFANDDLSISEAPIIDSLPVNEIEFVDTIGCQHYP